MSKIEGNEKYGIFQCRILPELFRMKFKGSKSSKCLQK